MPELDLPDSPLDTEKPLAPYERPSPDELREMAGDQPQYGGDPGGGLFGGARILGGKGVGGIQQSWDDRISRALEFGKSYS